MVRSRSKKRGGKSNTSEHLLPVQGRMLNIVVAVAAVVAIVFLLVNAIFETIGFGLILVLLWLGAIAWVLWRGQGRSLLRWWNLWLGAILFTLAVWGILSLFYPSGLIIGDAEFAKVSLGGNAGKNFIGSHGAGAPPAFRLAILIAAGIVLIVPRPSFRLLQLLYPAARATGLAIVVGARWLLPRVGQRLTEFYHMYSIRLRKKLRRKQIAEPEIGEEEAGVVALPPELEAAEGKAGAEAIGDLERPLPVVTGTKKKAAATAELKGAVPQPSATAKRQLPPMDLLDKMVEVQLTEADNMRRARQIEEALDSYGVEAKVVQINPGPSVTQFGVEPGWERKYKKVVERDHHGKVKRDKDGNPVERREEISKMRVKVERITALSNNLALALAVHSIRIEAPVPGKPLVGIEVPNTTSASVPLRGVIESPAFQKIKVKSNLAMALGKGAGGDPVAVDLSKMPHLLIAGTTGSGKTVCLNSIITCLLMHNSPQDVRMILIDRKRVELVKFDGVPHLILPVVTEIDKAIDSLRRAIREMDNRYTKFSAVGVRNIEGYNRSPMRTEPMPYLVLIVDELNDLMMSAAEVVEPAICRLAQLARATGIHIILATQRPSVDVVTGLIKANFPTRIAFRVAAFVDSRTILDTGGAEKLLGQGDMLYMPPDAAKPKRLRGCFVSDQEIERVVSFWRQQRDVSPTPAEDPVAQAFATLAVEEAKEGDPLLATGRRLAKEYSHLSTSLLQRRLHIGYPRAARIMDLLEEEGTVVRHEHDKPAEISEEDVEAEENEEVR